MLNEIVKCPIVGRTVIPEALGKYAERVLFHLQQTCNGECENKKEKKISLIAGVLIAAYELGVQDGVERSANRLRRLLVMKGGGLD